MEGPIRASEGRIDYLKFTFLANDPEHSLQVTLQFDALYERLRSEFGDWPGSYDKNRMYDGKGNWLMCYDISGLLSHKWLYEMPAEWLSNVTRIDVRAEISTGLTPQQIDHIYHTARGLNSKARNLDRKHARPRKKNDKRDAGGDLFSCGSLKSDKYFCVYTKPGERTAFELKVSGKPLGVLLQAARQAERASLNVSVPYGGVDYLLTRLQNMLRAHSREVSGNSSREWDEFFSRQEVEEQSTGLLSAPERVLSLFDQLPEDERIAVHNVITSTLYGPLEG